MLQTGQKTCHDSAGRQIPCAGSGQDAEYSSGAPWPSPRFELGEGVILDRLTGLTWLRKANPAEFPLDWQEALNFIDAMKHERVHGFRDWRLPDRRELRSLISHQARNPALPEGNPFTNVFLGWYWTATTLAGAPGFAWYIHMEGGRTFYGAKRQYYLVWPVRGLSSMLWPAVTEPRFVETEAIAGGRAIMDRRTGLIWRRSAGLPGEPALWEDALEAVRRLNVAESSAGARFWRLPNINELESLVDLDRHDPALSPGHPFTGCRGVYWSSTTSMFQPDWAWALYLNKGAVGVGRKSYARFHVWPVAGRLGS